MNHSAFVAAAAHDMKNSICVIAAYLEDALAQLRTEGASLPPHAAQLTCQALYETQRVNGNLVQLMAIYKLEEGMYPFQPDEVELDDFCEEALARVRPLAELKGLQLECVLPDDAGSWIFDHDLVSSVVVQSLFNAVRYARGRVCLALCIDGGRLDIRVDDDGPGFPEFMLAQGFASRQGIDARTGSTGLGLFFSRLVAELHRNGEQHGSTRLENGGSLAGGRFAVSLP